MSDTDAPHEVSEADYRGAPIDVAAHRSRRIEAADVLRLYRAEGWLPERRLEDVRAVLAEGPAVGAWDGDRLIAFARAVSDGHVRAYIEDVIVAKPYRRRGVAALMLSALREELRSVDVVSVFSTADLVPLYEAAGFQLTAQVVLHA